MMWRKAGFEESLVLPAKQDQNEMGGLQNEIGFGVHHVHEHVVVHYVGSTSNSQCWNDIVEWNKQTRKQADGRQSEAEKNEVQNEIKTGSDPTPTRHQTSHCRTKSQNLRNEIKRRRRDSLELLYWAHIINESRSHVFHRTHTHLEGSHPKCRMECFIVWS